MADETVTVNVRDHELAMLYLEKTLGSDVSPETVARAYVDALQRIKLAVRDAFSKR